VSNGRVIDTQERNSGRQRETSRRPLTTAQVLGVLALVLAHVFDWASFVVLMLQRGIGGEANPVVIHIARSNGLPGLTLAKLATIAFAALLFLLLAPRRPRLAYGLLIFGIAAGLIGGLSNLATL